MLYKHDKEDLSPGLNEPGLLKSSRSKRDIIRIRDTIATSMKDQGTQGVRTLEAGLLC